MMISGNNHRQVNETASELAQSIDHVDLFLLCAAGGHHRKTSTTLEELTGTQSFLRVREQRWKA
jgi:urease accessory protein UreE